MGPEAPLCELSLGPQRSGTVHLCPRGGSRTELHGQPTARHLPLVGCPTSCDVLRGQPPGPGAVALLHLCLACLSRLEVGGHSLTTLVCPACWILAWLWPGLAPCSLFLHLPCALCTRLLPLPSESLITVQQGPGPSAAQETFQGAPPPGLSKPSRPLLRWHRASLSPTSPGTRQGSDHTVA